MIQMVIQPVDINTPVILPDPWSVLEAQGFHRDILDRARGFMLWANRRSAQTGDENYRLAATETLRWLGEGFLKPFQASDVVVADDDPDRELKLDALRGLEGLAAQFGDRVSSVVWRAYAFLASRPNPREHATIISQKDHLPFHYGLADTVLHAVGKPYGFMLNLQSAMHGATGLVFEHNCDCSCDMHGPVEGEYKVDAPLLPERLFTATAALFSHLCCESILILVEKLPFEMGLSPEAQEAMAVA